jgi:hypothetical protein
MRRASLATLLFISSAASAQPVYLPDAAISPGALNPAVRQDNLSETVCAPGWTQSIRPSARYVAQLKRADMRSLNLRGAAHDYHEDHRVPLCAGGHPSDPRNLWPQPLEAQWRDADKNMLEQSVCRQLCRGDITLEEAQRIFLAPDWTQEYERYFQR